MSLRELMIGRILFAVSDEELLSRYAVAETDLEELSDLDLFELYESVVVEAV